MNSREILYRYFSLLLVLVITSWCTPVLYAQNSEFNKLFEEAKEQQYNNPIKSLELYKYLLKTDLERDAVFSIQLEQLHTYQILGQFIHAVETLQVMEQIAPRIANKELLFKYWLETAVLYKNLNFPKEAENSLLKAQEFFETLSTSQKETNRKYMEDVYFSFENYDRETDRIKKLKRIQSHWSAEQAKYTWLSYKLGELYYHVDKDSSLYHFKTVIESENQLLCPIASSNIKLLQDAVVDSTGNFTDTLKDESLNFDLRIRLLERIISYYEPNSYQDKLMQFIDLLDEMKVENSLIQRQAKSLLLENIYYNKQALEIQTAKITKRNHILIIFGLSILILGYLFYRKRQQITKAEKEVAKETTKSSSIPDKTEKEILKRLEAFEKSTLYLDKQLRIAGLAKYLKTNTRYLSVILNDKKNKSFNNYVNQLRIEYILNKLNNEPIYLSYKISYLAKECGFASQSSFSSSFKEVTGMPPSAYIKSIADKKKE